MRSHPPDPARQNLASGFSVSRETACALHALTRRAACALHALTLVDMAMAVAVAHQDRARILPRGLRLREGTVVAETQARPDPLFHVKHELRRIPATGNRPPCQTCLFQHCTAPDDARRHSNSGWPRIAARMSSGQKITSLGNFGSLCHRLGTDAPCSGQPRSPRSARRPRQKMAPARGRGHSQD